MPVSIERSAPSVVAGDQAVLARRYVDALYALAAQQDLVDVVATDLRGLRRVWDESEQWRRIACDPRLDDDFLAAAAEQVAHICDLDELTAHFLAVVARHRRLSIMPALIQTYLDQAAARRGEFRAEVRSARPLSAAQRDTLAASLNAAAGGKVHVTVTEDASLIGGLTVKMGSTLIDASVKNRLDQLERSLKGAA